MIRGGAPTVVSFWLEEHQRSCVVRRNTKIQTEYPKLWEKDLVENVEETNPLRQ